MKAETRQIHLLDSFSLIEMSQDRPHFGQEIGTDSSWIIPLVQPLQTLVAEALDHLDTVARGATRVNAMILRHRLRKSSRIGVNLTGGVYSAGQPGNLAVNEQKSQRA